MFLQRAKIVVLLVVSVAMPTLFAGNEPLVMAAVDQPAPTLEDIGEKGVEHYLRNKYKAIRDVRLEKVERGGYLWGGPERSIRISGEMVIPVPNGLGLDVEENGRRAAEIFLKEEGWLFGLTQKSEMREIRSHRSTLTDTFVYRFAHYISGIRLHGSDGVLNWEPGGASGLGGYISRVSAPLSPISLELLDALKQPTLSERDIRRLVKKELLSRGLDIRDIVSLELEKIALPFPPYVAWDTQVGLGGFNYTFDAFTGTILKETPYEID